MGYSTTLILLYEDHDFLSLNITVNVFTYCYCSSPTTVKRSFLCCAFSTSSIIAIAKSA